MTDDLSVQRAAEAIRQAFDRYHTTFKEMTRRSQMRFEQCDWLGAQRDAKERLDLYKQVVNGIVAEVQTILPDRTQDEEIWKQMKRCYSEIIAGRDDLELAETFFNSVTRRIFTTVGVNPDLEYVDSDFEVPLPGADSPIYRTYLPHGATSQTIEQLLRDFQFQVGYENLAGDAAAVAARLEAQLERVWGAAAWDRLEILKSLFYRNKGAYIVGRIRKGGELLPFVLPLVNRERGILVDAVLLDSNDASIVFSFARSYFHVEVGRPRELIHFLKSIMPLKPIAELYISIGYHKHGKTELYRDFLRHLRNSDDQFVIARGEKGMVMVAFTLPSYPVVFKVIKDRFDYPKSTTRERVMEKYSLVFKHDRVGRLVDAQEFEYLEFERERFSPELLAELQEMAANSVRIENNHVVVKHLYTERRLIPLNIYLKEAPEEQAHDAVIDYGNAIKDLAATNIFPGDVFLKNFGVTRHGRVVFYDYDELCLLTECKFRRIPQARSFEDEFAAEPWFHVDVQDVFPQEFASFIGLSGGLRETFMAHHGDLCDVEFWRQMQGRQRAGEIVDIFPYRPSIRLRRDGTG